MQKIRSNIVKIITAGVALAGALFGYEPTFFTAEVITGISAVIASGLGFVVGSKAEEKAKAGADAKAGTSTKTP